MRPRKALVLLGLSAVIGMLPYVRVGAYCCDPWGQVGATAFINAGKVVVGTLTEAVSTLSGYLQMSFSMTISNGFARWAEELNKRSVKQSIGSEGTAQVSSQLYMEGKRAEAAEKFGAAIALDQSVTNGLMLEEQAARERTMRLEEGRRLSNDLRPVADIRESVATRHAEFCGPRGFEAGVCKELAPTPLQNADVQVTTLLTPGGGQYETLSDAEVRAGRAFIRNVLKPTPVLDLPVEGASPLASAYHSELLADEAALSLAGHSLNSIMMSRVRKNGAAATEGK